MNYLNLFTQHILGAVPACPVLFSFSSPSLSLCSTCTIFSRQRNVTCRKPPGISSTEVSVGRTGSGALMTLVGYMRQKKKKMGKEVNERVGEGGPGGSGSSATWGFWQLPPLGLLWSHWGRWQREAESWAQGSFQPSVTHRSMGAHPGLLSK